VLGFGAGIEGASSGSAALCSFQTILWLISGGPVCGLCVWLVWRCVKIGRVCCCGFVDEIRRVRCPVSGFRWYVPSGGLVWNLDVNDTNVLLVVGMVLSVVLEQGASFCGSETGVRSGGWASVGRGKGQCLLLGIR
jgi:hypothetical protein